MSNNSAIIVAVASYSVLFPPNLYGKYRDIKESIEFVLE